MISPRGMAILLMVLAALGLLVPWSAEIALALAVLSLAAGLAAPAIARGRAGGALSELPVVVVLLSLARMVVALVAVKGIVAPGAAGADLMRWLSAEVGVWAAVAMFGVVAVAAGMVLGSGAVRVAEVAARFALDALPGRQLGVDTALQGGALDASGAAERLSGMEAEAAFFGAMDGATRFLRAESLALTVLGVLALGLGGGLQAAEWAGPVTFGAAVFGLLLAATAGTAAQSVLAVTEAAGGAEGAARGAAVDPRVLPVALTGAGGLLLVVGAVSRPPAGALLAGGLAAAAAGVYLLVRGRPGGEDAEPGGVWAVAVAAGAEEREATGAAARATAAPRVPSEEAVAEVLAVVRDGLAARLGFDVGRGAVVRSAEGRGTRGGAARVLVRGMEAGRAEARPGEVLVALAEEGEGADGAAAPDGRPAEWAPAAGGAGGWGWREVLEWGTYARLVAAAELLFTPAQARRWVEEAREALPPDMARGLGVTAAMSALRGLLRAGLPVVPPALGGEAMVLAEGEAREGWLRRLAAKRLLAEAGEGLLARQLHTDGRMLLDQLASGAPMGRELDALRQTLARAAWDRPDWRWPMVLVEGRWTEQLTTFLAGGTAEIVVLRPDELPASLPLPAIEVLDNGLRESP